MVMVMVPVLAGGLNTNCSRAATEKCRNLIHRDGSRWRWKRKALPWIMVAGIKPPLPIYNVLLWPGPDYGYIFASCSGIQQSSGETVYCMYVERVLHVWWLRVTIICSCSTNFCNLHVVSSPVSLQWKCFQSLRHRNQVVSVRSKIHLMWYVVRCVQCPVSLMSGQRRTLEVPCLEETN